ncbi:MAG: undecaprenyldiphospho-muramoylpentapeptide beta-N-acetylglucosaminyltransferase [Rhodospirillaceae bacterium]|nr:undecaprenyldiphospho-muramoylpentapeptide beta-N-acetylglucosaminyltransferase [Rhodospirillaceae bacterium]
MTTRDQAPLIILAAGGTGGHVFPAEAVAQELLAQNYRLALVTDGRGERYGGTLSLIDKHFIRAGYLAGRGLFGKAQSAVELVIGTVQAYRLIKRLQPAVVVGFGGYAAAPTVAAAVMAGVPTVIHEQNAILGWANRKLAAYVSKVCTSYDLARPAPAKAHLIRTGMPVRPAVADVRSSPYRAPAPGESFRILVMGGSQGARVFTDVLPAAIKLLPPEIRQRIEISQQCRPEDIDRAHAAYAGLGVHVELRHFFDNVPELLNKAHVLISRSGASTVAETTITGRPSILVPYPYAADDHQTANAKALDIVGGGWLMPQSEFTPEALAEKLAALIENPQMLSDTSAAALAFSIPDAAGRMAAVVTGFTHGQNGARAGRNVSNTSVSATVTSMHNTNKLDRRPLDRAVPRGAA